MSITGLLTCDVASVITYKYLTAKHTKTVCKCAKRMLRGNSAREIQKFEKNWCILF